MKEQSFVSGAKWKINLDGVVQLTHLNDSRVKLPENRDENLTTLQD